MFVGAEHTEAAEGLERASSKVIGSSEDLMRLFWLFVGSLCIGAAGCVFTERSNRSWTGTGSGCAQILN